MDVGVLRMPEGRKRTIRALCEALVAGDLDLTADQGEQPYHRVREELLAIVGIGPWTVEVVVGAALGDKDAFPATDLLIAYAAQALGLPKGRALLDHAEQWRPWRGYAAQHLYAVDLSAAAAQASG